MCNVRSLSLGVWRELHERVVVPTLKHRAETCSMRKEETQRQTRCNGNEVATEYVQSD